MTVPGGEWWSSGSRPPELRERPGALGRAGITGAPPPEVEAATMAPAGQISMQAQQAVQAASTTDGRLGARRSARSGQVARQAPQAVQASLTRTVSVPAGATAWRATGRLPDADVIGGEGSGTAGEALDPGEVAAGPGRAAADVTPLGGGRWGGTCGAAVATAVAADGSPLMRARRGGGGGGG